MPVYQRPVTPDRMQLLLQQGAERVREATDGPLPARNEGCDATFCPSPDDPGPYRCASIAGHTGAHLTTGKPPEFRLYRW